MVRDPDRLKEMAMGFFQELYTSEGPRDFEPVLQQCPALVTAKINQNLIAQVTMEEVHTIAFQLGSLKAP